MGAESVAYHEQTVLGRADDHPGRALDYYGSRGETPLRWAGAGAARLGLQGEVTPEAYRSAFGPGGFRDPLTGDQLVRTTRPGFELVVSAHKSLSLLGVAGRADDMHAILDAETSGTLGYLDAWMQARGGRRGRAAVATPTSGLVYAVTRHATSRLGDPALHDHVLIANVGKMLDARGGYKGLYSALVRDTAEAAAMAGRLRSAARAIELGYAIELDPGESGRARDWRIAGIPAEVCEIFSKRSDQIADYLAEKGYTGYRASNIAARNSRPVKRHPEIVTTLGDNLRQRDPAERVALEHLRGGYQLAAIRFYATNQRIHIAPTRVDALAAMVDAWATDAAAGRDALMLAWRRASVADLNRLARVRAEQLGWLTGPDLVSRDGRGYAVGDPVVTLAPNHRGELVTSQRGRVIAIDQQARMLTMVTDDGRRVTLARTDIDTDHLDHGYALTVHREQGATADRTHYLAEGGGRELAYVAMSRARGPSVVHAVADSLDQAIEDISHDWSSDRTQRWITRTAQVGVDDSMRTTPEDGETRRARLLSELAALERRAPPSVTADLAAAREDVDRLRQDRQDLSRGLGRWRQAPAGRAARQLEEARREHQHANNWAEQPHTPRGERNRWRRIARDAGRAVAQAEADWSRHTAPVAEKLDRRIARAEHRVADLESQARFRSRWLNEHPELARRLEHTKRELQRLRDPVGVEMLERSAAVLQPVPAEANPSLERPDVARIREHLNRLQQRREIDPPALSL
jgi:conjugative relaxase-like TrwC/TraI family protein